MKKYTVILMYPDYAADNYGDTWCQAVNATDPAHAVTVAQEECMADNKSSIDKADDLKPVSVFEGDHNDLVGVWVEAQNR